jgi:hypothetical protein
MFWLLYLGRQSQHPLLQPKEGPITIRETPMYPGHPNSPVLTEMSLPHGVGLQTYGKVPPRLVHKVPTYILPEYNDTLEAVRDGTLEQITIFNTNVFYASIFAIDELIELAGGLPQKQSTRPTRRKQTLPPLTDTQREVLNIIKNQPAGDAIMSKAIASRLSIAESSLTRHIIPNFVPTASKIVAEPGTTAIPPSAETRCFGAVYCARSIHRKYLQEVSGE